MEQQLRNVLIETLNDYKGSRLFNLYYMYKSYCANEEEERLYGFGLKMEMKVDIIKEWIELEEDSSEFLLKVIRNLVEEALDDFYEYLPKDGDYYDDGEREWCEKSLRNIETLRRDFLKYPKPLLDLWYRDEEFMETDQTGPDF